MTRWLWTLALVPLLAIGASAAPAIDDQADAQAIVDKAIKAIGGAEKLAKLNSCVEKVKATVFASDGTSTEYTCTTYCELPGKWRWEWEGHRESATMNFVMDRVQLASRSSNIAN